MKNNLDLKSMAWRSLSFTGWLLFLKVSFEIPSSKSTL